MFIIYLSTFIVLIFSSTIVGNLILKCSKLQITDAIGRFFISNILGLVFMVSTYSFYNLGFNTLYWTGIVFLLLFIFIKKDKKLIEQENWSAKKIGIVTIIFCVTITLLYLSFIESWSPFVLINMGDDLYYAKLSKNLTISHDENRFQVYNLLLPSLYKGTSPYHFFDLWLNNLISKLNGQNSYSNLILIVYPYFKFLIFVGFYCLTNTLSHYKNGIMNLFISFCLLFWCGFYFEFYNNYFLYHTFQVPLFGNVVNKANTVNLVLIAVFYLWFIRKEVVSLMFLSLIPLLYSTTVFVFWCPVCFFALLVYIKAPFFEFEKQLWWFWVLVSSLVITVLAIKSPQILSNNNNFSISYLTSVVEHFSVKTMFNIIAGSVITFIVGYFFAIVLFAYKHTLTKDFITQLNAKPLIAIQLLSITFGLFFWAIFYMSLDSVQLFSLGGVQMLNLFVVCLIIFVTTRIKSNYLSVPIWLYFGYLACSQIRKDISHLEIDVQKITFEKASVSMANEYPSNKLVANLLGKEDFDIGIYSWGQYTMSSDYMFAIDDSYRSLSLSDFERQINKNIENNYLDKLRFENINEIGFYYNYLKIKKNDPKYPYKYFPNNSFEHQLDFLKTHKVRFAVISQHYPYKNLILNKALKKIYNKNSGQWFVVL
jgi:hypothetical protein